MDTSNINLLSLIEQDTTLKRAASTNGGEWHGPCPFCGGKDRFIVQPYSKQGGWFWCRQCKTSGDAITYVRKRLNLSYEDALAYLRLEPMKKSQFHSSPAIHVESSAVLASVWNAPALTDEVWQQEAKGFCRTAYKTLWSSAGSTAREFLHKRGFNDETIRSSFVGFNQHYIHQHWGKTEVKLGEGIVIPWLIDKQLWAVKLRYLDNRTPKYTQASGGANALYNANAVSNYSKLVLVEGEFDALSIAQSVGSDYLALATGSASGARRLYWLIQISQAKEVILAFDNDPAGEEASLWWANQLAKLRIAHYRLRPLQKDVNEMLMLGENIKAWLSS